MAKKSACVSKGVKMLNAKMSLLSLAQELAEQKLRTLSEENEQKILEITKGTASKEKALLLQIQSLEQVYLNCLWNIYFNL